MLFWSSQKKLAVKVKGVKSLCIFGTWQPYSLGAILNSSLKVATSFHYLIVEQIGLKQGAVVQKNVAA